MARGDFPQLAIGQVHEARFSLRLAIAEGAEETGYLAITLALHYFLGSGSANGVVSYKAVAFHIDRVPPCSHWPGSAKSLKFYHI
jgi:hypothetical protein